MSLLRVTLALTLVVYVLGDKADNKDFVPTKNKTEAPGEKVLARAARSYAMFNDMLRGIFPGTRWCGRGNITKKDDELGVFHATDACCRAHDNCPLIIESTDNPANLTKSENCTKKHDSRLYGRSNCTCEKAFHECLKNVHDKVSRIVGKLYFNCLGPQCLSRDYPITGCTKWIKSKLWGKRCVAYGRNKMQPPKLQCKDNPFF